MQKRQTGQKFGGTHNTDRGKAETPAFAKALAQAESGKNAKPAGNGVDTEAARTVTANASGNAGANTSASGSTDKGAENSAVPKADGGKSPEMIIAEAVDKLRLNKHIAGKLSEKLNLLYSRTAELNPDIAETDILNAVLSKLEELLKEILREFIKNAVERHNKGDILEAEAEKGEDDDSVGNAGDTDTTLREHYDEMAAAYLRGAGVGDLIAAAAAVDTEYSMSQQTAVMKILACVPDDFSASYTPNDFPEDLSKPLPDTTGLLLPEEDAEGKQNGQGVNPDGSKGGNGGTGGIVLPHDDEFLAAAKSIVNAALLRNALDGDGGEDLFGTSFGARNDLLAGLDGETAVDAGVKAVSVGAADAGTAASVTNAVTVTAAEALAATVASEEADAAAVNGQAETEQSTDTTEQPVQGISGGSDTAKDGGGTNADTRSDGGERDTSGDTSRIIDLAAILAQRAANAQPTHHIAETPRETLMRYITNQVSEVIDAHITPLTDGIREFTLTLNPHQMGRVVIKLVTEGSSVSVSIMAENAETHALLAGRGEHLGSVLGKTGAELVKYEVTHTEQGQNQQSDEFGHQKERQGQSDEQAETNDAADDYADYGFADMLNEVSAAQAV